MKIGLVGMLLEPISFEGTYYLRIYVFTSKKINIILVFGRKVGSLAGWEKEGEREQMPPKRLKTLSLRPLFRRDVPIW